MNAAVVFHVNARSRLKQGLSFGVDVLCVVQGVCRMSTSQPSTTHIFKVLKHLQALNIWSEEGTHLLKTVQRLVSFTNLTNLYYHINMMDCSAIELSRSYSLLST